MTARYNPHKIEKQARKWPVSLSADSLAEDIKMRMHMLWKKVEHVWLTPTFCDSQIDDDLLREYGTDAARLAIICAQGDVTPSSLLESSFKWLARLDAQTNYPAGSSFNEVPWLEAAMQGHDHVIARNNPYSGLALVRRALRLAPPTKDLSAIEKDLVISTIYPYCPFWAIFNLAPDFRLPAAIPDIATEFKKFICIRFSLPAGGWHWKVFDRLRFQADPAAEFCNVVWVKKASQGKKIKLEASSEGTRVCFI